MKLFTNNQHDRHSNPLELKIKQDINASLPIFGGATVGMRRVFSAEKLNHFTYEVTSMDSHGIVMTHNVTQSVDMWGCPSGELVWQGMY